MKEPCSVRKRSLAEWCTKGDAYCDLSLDAQVDRLCGERVGCTSELSCVQLWLTPNSCGGSSIQATYGIDALLVTHHYDGQARLVGAEVAYGNSCEVAMRISYELDVYGTECTRSDGQRPQCAAADGGV